MAVEQTKADECEYQCPDCKRWFHTEVGRDDHVEEDRCP
jgi:hypothetical protein